MRLSRHFLLSELIKSEVALRYNVDNTPDEKQIEALNLVVKEILEPMRLHFGVPISPSSGYRSIHVNRLIGSKDTSQHTRGQAVDFEVPGIANDVLASTIRAMCKFDQLILEFYQEGEPHSGWVHASVVAGHNRGKVMIYNGKSYTEI